VNHEKHLFRRRRHPAYLHICISDKSIVREVSQDWHANISYAEDGSIVEIVLLDAFRQ